MVDLIHERFATYYHADKMSTTFVFCFLLYIIMIITPFLISFTAGQFWIRAAYYFEQPSITQMDQYVMVVQTTGESYFYTNIPDILSQRPISSSIPTVIVTSQSEEARSSDQPTLQNFTISVNLQQKASEVRFVQILVLFRYMLTQTVKLQMQSLAEVSLNSQAGLSQATVIGSLDFSQTHPLSSGTTYRDTYDYPPYYDAQGALLLDPIQITASNSMRNESIITNYQSWVRPALRADDLASIEIQLKVPKNQEIIYEESLLETMKFAWVQYFSLFLVFWIAVTNSVFPTYKVNDLPRHTKTYNKKKLD